MGASFIQSPLFEDVYVAFDNSKDSNAQRHGKNATHKLRVLQYMYTMVERESPLSRMQEILFLAFLLGVEAA